MTITEEVEDKLITIALANTGCHKLGCRIHAAKILGMSVRTLYRKIRKRRKNNKEQQIT